jgi:hypothetical protein
MLRTLIIVALSAAPIAAAQRSPILIGVDEGARVRPLARVDGRTWSPTCDAPPAPSRGQTRGTIQLPVVTIAGDAAVEAIEYVPRGGAAWRQIEPIVLRTFQVQERLQNVSLNVLVGIPTDVESIATSVEPATRPIYYFTASKTVPSGAGPDLNADGAADPQGDLRIDVIGWVRLGAAGVAEKNLALGSNTTLTWEQVDRPLRNVARRTRLNPLGIVRIRDTGIWVMQGRSGESMWFSLYDVGVGGVRMVARSDPQQC